MQHGHQHPYECDPGPAVQRGHRAPGDVEVGEHADDAEEDGDEGDDPDDARGAGVLRAEEHVDDYSGHCGKDREGREPDGGDQSERLSESLADAGARAASGGKPRKSYCHKRPWQEHGDMARDRRGRVATRSDGREEVTSQEYVDPGQRGVPGERGDRQHGVAQGDPYWVESPGEYFPPRDQEEGRGRERLADHRRRHSAHQPEARRDEQGTAGQPQRTATDERGDGDGHEAQLAEQRTLQDSGDYREGDPDANGQVRSGGLQVQETIDQR